MAVQGRNRTYAKNSRRAYGYERNYEIDGNTVRKRKPAEKDRRHIDERPLRKKRQQEQARRRAQRNRERALYMNPGYVMFLLACTFSVFLICAMSIHLQSQKTNYISSISSLESELVELRSDNDETELRLETSLDLQEIKEQAFALGMQYPTSDQIVYYSVENTDSMTQYSNANAQASTN